MAACRATGQRVRDAGKALRLAKPCRVAPLDRGTRPWP
jgi:hypothetical protein